MTISHIILYIFLGYMVGGFIAVLLTAINSPELVQRKSKLPFIASFFLFPFIIFFMLVRFFFYLFEVISDLIGKYVWKFLDLVSRLSPDYWHGEQDTSEGSEDERIFVNSDEEQREDDSCSCPCRREK